MEPLQDPLWFVKREKYNEEIEEMVIEFIIEFMVEVLGEGKTEGYISDMSSPGLSSH